MFSVLRLQNLYLHYEYQMVQPHQFVYHYCYLYFLSRTNTYTQKEVKLSNLNFVVSKQLPYMHN